MIPIVPLINMNYDGLKTTIIEMLSGDKVKVKCGNFLEMKLQ